METNKRTCVVDQCQKPVIARGACHRHYKQWQTHGVFDLSKLPPKICSIEGCGNKSYARNMCPKHFEKLRNSEGYKTKHERKPASRYTASKWAAIKRGLSWSLTLDEFSALILLPCHYCGNPLPETRSGLDRKDNSVGYEIGNVTPCCTICNRMKSNLFTYEEFLQFAGTDLFKHVRARIKRGI